MRLRTLFAGAAAGALAAIAGPAFGADLTTDRMGAGTGAATTTPEVRQFHREMGVEITPEEARAAEQVPGPDLMVGRTPRGETTVVVTQRHAYPELFAAQVDGIARVAGGAQREPIDPQAPVDRPD